MVRPRVGLLVFSESFSREDVYQKRKATAAREVKRFVESIGDEVEVVWPSVREIRGKRQAVAAVRELEALAVDAAILYIPIFVAPAVVAHAANLLTMPVVLACNEAEDSLSQLAFLAAGGAVDQIGLNCRRIPGDAAVEPHRSQLLAFARAASAKQRLRGETFGCFGGRSLGISTGTADAALWQKVFGVDIEHIDQFEIARLAEELPGADVKRHLKWIRQYAASVELNDSNFTAMHLDRQVRSYLATRRMAETYELDFIGVKCQPEMSNGYCLQCLNVSMCNDPHDADGPKPPLPCSCEADADGALTMRILNIVSGGKATSLNDIAWMTDREMTLANCGAMGFYFAAMSDDPRENMAGVDIVPHVFGEAGGAAVRFTVPAGVEMTYARLFRKGDCYKLGVLTGKTTEKDRESQSPTIQSRPLIFVAMNIDKDHFLNTFGSNHILAVEGNLKRELQAFAELVKIEYVDYDL